MEPVVVDSAEEVVPVGVGEEGDVEAGGVLVGGDVESNVVVGTGEEGVIVGVVSSVVRLVEADVEGSVEVGVTPMVSEGKIVLESIVEEVGEG